MDSYYLKNNTRKGNCTPGIALRGHNCSAWMLISSQLASKHAGPNKYIQHHLSSATLQRWSAAVTHCCIPYHTDDKDIYTAFCYKEHSGEIPAPSLVILGGLCIRGLLITLSTKQWYTHIQIWIILPALVLRLDCLPFHKCPLNVIFR